MRWKLIMDWSGDDLSMYSHLLEAASIQDDEYRTWQDARLGLNEDATRS
jgi:hypothetical protein